MEVLGREETQSPLSGRILLCWHFADHSCRRLLWQKTWYNSTVGLRQKFCKGATFVGLGIIQLALGTKGKVTAQSSAHYTENCSETGGFKGLRFWGMKLWLLRVSVCVCMQAHVHTSMKICLKKQWKCFWFPWALQAVSCGSEQACVKRVPHLPSSHSSVQDSDDDVKSNVRETALEIMLWDSSHISEGVAGFLSGPEK